MANPVSSSVIPRQSDVAERLTPGLHSLFCGTCVRLGVHMCGPSSDPICSVARLGGFPPNWAVLNLIVRVNIGLGGWTKIGLVFGQFGGFQNI